LNDLKLSYQRTHGKLTLAYGAFKPDAMDGYAPAYVGHNVPLLVVSGLGLNTQNDMKDGGIRISSEIASVESDDAAALLRHFRDSDASNLAWNSKEHSGRNKFNIRTVGRVFQISIASTISTKAS